MQHHFDIEIAKKYGVNVAIFLNNLVFWIQKNAANNKHFHDGRCWTYNSVKAYEILFPYWTKRQIETIINNCVKNNLILKGNYNKAQYDRTCWYALTDLAEKLLNITISQKCEMENSEMQNGFSQNVEPIPDNKPDNKPDREREENNERFTLSDFSTDYLPDKHDDEMGKEHNLDLLIVFEKFMHNLRSKKKKTFTRSDWKLWLTREIGHKRRVKI
jgi:hypothetical protein